MYLMRLEHEPFIRSLEEVLDNMANMNKLHWNSAHRFGEMKFGPCLLMNI
jgi:hypothetical protein